MAFLDMVSALLCLCVVLPSLALATVVVVGTLFTDKVPMSKPPRRAPRRVRRSTRDSFRPIY